MRKIKYIIVHHNGVSGRDIENIRRSHKKRGFSDVGYHYVIKENGVIQRGRPESKVGAHAQGLNANSIGVCVIGNYSKQAFPQHFEQHTALLTKLDELVEAYPGAIVIGHREINHFVPKRFKTRKQCPGTRFSMKELRAALVVDNYEDAGA